MDFKSNLSGILGMISCFINGCVCALYLLLVIIMTQRFCSFIVRLFSKPQVDKL